MRRMTWIVGVVCTILLADLFLFGQFLPPLLWHVWHGNSVTMHGVRFKVPLLYKGDGDLQINRLWIITVQSRFRRKVAAITIDFHKQPPLPADSAQLKEIEEKFGGMHMALSRKLMLAGHEGECVEYVPVNKNQGNGIVLVSDGYRIDCRFGDDMAASFSGTQNAIQNFYAVLQSAEAVKGKD
jgi:hypothetical protein